MAGSLFARSILAGDSVLVALLWAIGAGCISYFALHFIIGENKTEKDIKRQLLFGYSIVLLIVILVIWFFYKILTP